MIWALLAGKRADGKGLVLAETDEQTLLGEGNLRLVCARKLGACQLFDLSRDPGETRDASADLPKEFGELRARLKALGASHGRYEQKRAARRRQGLASRHPTRHQRRRRRGGRDRRAAGRRRSVDPAQGCRAPIRAQTPGGQACAAPRPGRDEDEVVRRYARSRSPRLGEGAPLTFELEKSPDLAVRRLAALVLPKAATRAGEKTLIAWWLDAAARNFDRSRQIAAALGVIRAKDAVWPLVQSLDDVRLRPYLAEALAHIGGELSQGSLLKALSGERSQSTRVALVEALVTLKTEEALAAPLVRFMGVPDPLLNGLEAAVRSKILEHVGGPDGQDLARLRKQSALGVSVTLTIHPAATARECARSCAPEPPAARRGSADRHGRAGLGDRPAQAEPAQSRRRSSAAAADPTRSRAGGRVWAVAQELGRASRPARSLRGVCRQHGATRCRGAGAAVRRAAPAAPLSLGSPVRADLAR